MKSILTFLAALLICGASYGQNVLASYHFESEDADEVSVMGSFCDVYVKRGDKVVFDGIIEGSGEEGDYVIASIRNGNMVVFKVEQKRKASNWSWQNIERARIDLTIPDGVIFKVDNTSGAVNVEGLSGGDYRVETTSGDIYLKQMSGSLYAKCTSGDVVMEDYSGDITMQSTSGDQEYRRIVGNLETRATSGDVDVRSLMGSLRIKATSGDLQFNQVEGAISLTTTSGNMKGSRILLKDGSNVQATSGDISIEFINDLEDISFDLTSTSGDLQAGSIDGEGRLMLKRGSILFQGNTTSGDQTYRD